MLNQNYIVLFDLEQRTKEKRLVRNPEFPSMWNHQSLMVRSQIYMTGGAIAHTRTYLK